MERMGTTGEGGPGDGHVSDLLPGRARGELGAEEAERVERHLEACAACREEAAIVGLLAGAPRAVPGAAERSLALEAIQRRRAAAGSWRAGLWRAAAAVALLLTGLGVWRMTATRPAAEGWSAAGVVAAFERDLAELDLGAPEARLALGVPPGADGWETLGIVEEDGAEGGERNGGAGWEVEP